jgi:hypothetical protein
VFERSEAPFPRLWGPGPAPPFYDLATAPPNANGSPLMFFVCLLFAIVRFCYLA